MKKYLFIVLFILSYSFTLSQTVLKCSVLKNSKFQV